MKHRAALFTTILFILFAAGCGKPKKQEPESSKAVEDFTGITTIKQGEKMKKRIEDIRKAEDPFTSVSRGCLFHAINSMKHSQYE